MSTENNIDAIFKDSLKILSDLIAFKTISGEDNNSLINYCDKILKKIGATSFKTFDDEKKRVNLFATIKSKKPNILVLEMLQELHKISEHCVEFPNSIMFDGLEVPKH